MTGQNNVPVLDFAVARSYNHTVFLTIVKPDGSPWPLDSALLRWRARRPAGGPVAIEKDSGLGSITITNPAGGLAEFTLTPADLAGLSGSYPHELAIKDGASEGPGLQGDMTVLASLFE